MLFCGLRCIYENARSVGGANEHQKSCFCMTHDESKSSKQVKKGSQQSRSVRQKVQGAKCHRDITQEKEVQFSSSELQSHTQRATECHCLDARLKRNLAGHTIDPETYFKSATVRGCSDAKAENKSRWPHDSPDAFKRVFFAMIIAAGQNHPRQSPSHR